MLLACLGAQASVCVVEWDAVVMVMVVYDGEVVWWWCIVVLYGDGV